MRIAVIDLGTNTFNLLIAEVEGKSYKTIFGTKEGVKLGEGGINRKVITDAAFQRGINTIARYHDLINQYKVDKVIALATSAIRDAANGNEFEETLKNRFNLTISTITGDKEAELIYYGVRQTLTISQKRFLILDIGGGSNEFILADDQKIFWARSFKLGMARLLEQFNPSDPITAKEINDMEAYLKEELIELFDQVSRFNPEIFIGASGSFDSFVSMLATENQLEHINGNVFNHIPLDIYEHLHQKLIQSTRTQRDHIPGLEPVRRDMIVLASIFVNFVLKETKLQTMYQSAYSLKEGALYEAISK
jgi:exopolyphosphatase / guanosine-5'-triphosphate,3'-diphosphate pyrophosphatase